MKERIERERGNGIYICDIPSFPTERNALRYKGTGERHIYIGGSRGRGGQKVDGSSRPTTRGMMIFLRATFSERFPGGRGR